MLCWRADVQRGLGICVNVSRRLGFKGTGVKVKNRSGWVELQSRAPVSAASRACTRPLSPASLASPRSGATAMSCVAADGTSEQAISSDYKSSNSVADY